MTKPTAEQRKYGSFGTASDLSGVKLTDVESVRSMAERGGWADPTAFSPEMLVQPDAQKIGRLGDFDQSHIAVTTQFKPEFAEARGMVGNVPNRVVVEYRDVNTGKKVTKGGSFWDDPAYEEDEIVSKPFYKVLAGQIQGQKKPTKIYYEYDDTGKFLGANIDVETRWYEDAAPLIAMAGMALTFGGAAGSIGSYLNNTLGMGLGEAGQLAAGKAAIGAGQAVLTGQNPLPAIATSALTNVAGGTVTKALTDAGISADTAKMLAGAGTGALTAASKGGNAAEGALMGGLNAGGKGLGLVANALKMYQANKSAKESNAQAEASRKALEEYIRWLQRPIQTRR